MSITTNFASADELTSLDVTERTDSRLFLGWNERPPCVMCGTATRYAAPNLGWIGESCDAGCCTSPAMPQCASCTADIAPDTRAELANADEEAAR